MRSANAMTSADNVEGATLLDLYDLHETGLALLDNSIRCTIRPNCEDKSTWFANAASLCARTQSVMRSSFGIHINAMISCAYFIALLRLLQCLDECCSKKVRVTCAVFRNLKCEVWPSVG